MFDISFWEILVIGVVALLVVGPNEFPALVRKVGHWLGRARQLATAVKTEFHREIEKTEEIKRRMEEEMRVAEMHKILDETRNVIPVDYDARRAAQQPAAEEPVAPVPSLADAASPPADSLTPPEAPHEAAKKP